MSFPESNHFPPFEPCFPHWDSHEPPVFYYPPKLDEEPAVFTPDAPSQEPVRSNSGSDTSTPISVPPNSGSDEPKRKRSKTSTPGSEEPIIDERKRRRMISNRESARRSRMRKQRHLENLRNTFNRLGTENRELMNQVRFAAHQNQLVGFENENLRSEAVALRQRLWDIRQVLLVRQLQQHLNIPSAWPCNNFTSINEGSQLPQHYSLST